MYHPIKCPNSKIQKKFYSKDIVQYNKEKRQYFLIDDIHLYVISTYLSFFSFYDLVCKYCIKSREQES